MTVFQSRWGAAHSLKLSGQIDLPEHGCIRGLLTFLLQHMHNSTVRVAQVHEPVRSLTSCPLVNLPPNKSTYVACYINGKY